MKTKNLVLGMVALFVAVGSAFASLVMEDVYINVRYEDSEEFECRLVGQCDNSGALPCKVTVTVSPAPATTYQAFKSDCITLATNTSSSSIATVPPTPVIVDITNPTILP